VQVHDLKQRQTSPGDPGFAQPASASRCAKAYLGIEHTYLVFEDARGCFCDPTGLADLLLHAFELFLPLAGRFGRFFFVLGLLGRVMRYDVLPPAKLIGSI